MFRNRDDKERACKVKTNQISSRLYQNSKVGIRNRNPKQILNKIIRNAEESYGIDLNESSSIFNLKSKPDFYQGSCQFKSRDKQDLN